MGALKPPKNLVWVCWVDAMGVSTDWTAIEALKKQQAPPHYSVGWLLAETEEKIIILPHWGENNYGCGEMTIPRANVKAVYWLKPKKGKL